MSSFKRKMQRQIQKNNGTLLHKKVVARKMGCKSVEEYNRRMARREKNLKEMEDNKDGNEKLKVEYLLEHLEQVQIFPDKVIVIVPILSEGIVVEKTQYVSREKWSR